MRKLAVLAAIFAAMPAFAQDSGVGIVEKKIFEMPSYTTVGGATIPNLRVGWESYGRLNAARDNVVIVPHFFSGNSNAAGRYRAEQAAAGYWDGIIGPGKAIDTDKYFVISVDSLVNLNVRDGVTVSTGPASIEPGTNRPYGMRFPIVTIRDFVNVQKALLDQLGVASVHAAVGASMGSFQALEWAAAFPDFVKRVVPVIGVGEADAYTIARLGMWAQPILMDPNFKNGDWYGGPEPTAGLAFALKMVTIDARHHGWADAAFGRRWAAIDRNPLASWENRFAIEATLDQVALARARASDANHFVYLVRANQLFVTGHRANLEEGLGQIKARALFVPAESDLLLVPAYAQKAVDILKRQGKQADLVAIPGNGGHLDGVLAMARVAARLKAFLDE
ncbi:MAG: homoserine O-acetyltransferase [Magnetospirillum sp.]|nr:homoserine O-acetyltransferase [Magnetospirillum sp.]